VVQCLISLEGLDVTQNLIERLIGRLLGARLLMGQSISESREHEEHGVDGSHKEDSRFLHDGLAHKHRALVEALLDLEKRVIRLLVHYLNPFSITSVYLKSERAHIG
jgi:hypothetical protein